MSVEQLAELLARQTRRWEIDRRAGMPQPRGAVVGVSRLPASGGDEVARRVAEWLDYGFFDREVIDRIAGDAGLRGRLDADLAPAARVAIERLLQEFCARARDEALRGMLGVVATLAERGMAVLVGGSAVAILPPSRALRVLVVAPSALRAERLAATEGLASQVAVARLAELDAARAALLRTQLGVADEDPCRYDLVLNTESLPIDAAAALVVEALRRRAQPAPQGA